MNTLIKNKNNGHGPASMRDLFFNDDWFNAFYENNGMKIQHFAPNADIIEKEKEFLITVALPGMTKENIKIDLLDNKLSISGEVKKEEVTEKDRFVTKEIVSGSFHREFKLGNQVDSSKIDASFKDGLLNITLPKSEKAAPKAISVK